MTARSIRRAHERGRGRKLASGAGAALGATALFSPAADAATFTVTSLDDSTADGTLRGEVIDANLSPGADDLVFASGLSGTITLDGGQIEVYGDALEIQGPGAGTITVSGDDAQRILYLHDIPAGDEVVISGLTLTQGRPSGPGEPGGAILSDDGTTSAPDVTIRDAVISDSYSDLHGGAVQTDDGILTITRSVLTGNESASGGGAVFVLDTRDTPADDVEVLIEDSTLAGNTAQQWGGALYLEGPDGDAVIRRSTFAGNQAGTSVGGGGGAIDVVGVYGGGDFIVDQSTFSDNTALYEGGAMNLDGIEGDTVISNTTLTGNQVLDPDGGGAIYFEYADSGTPPQIENSTIAGNSTAGQGGAIYLDEGGPVVISSSIIADNSASDGDLAEDSASSPDGFELGYSLVEDTGGNGTVDETPAGSNLLGVDPLLGPLADNGGPTQTHLPALTSPVLDAGIANGLDTDQRGLARTADLSAATNAAGGDGTDIGALEIQAAACKGANAPAFTGTEGDDSLTGTAGQDAIAGLAGNDGLAALEGDDCVSGDDGDDTADGGAGNDELDGGAGNDAVTGAAGKDLLTAGAGADRAAGNGGKDKLKGEAGKDKLKGGGGKDKLVGAGGKDRLSGGGGKDKLKGGPGKDRIKTGGGRDKVNCGGGKDRVAAGPDDRIAANCERVL